MAVTRTGAFCRAVAVRAALRGLCLAAAIASASAQIDRPPDEALVALQERGRLIALYLQAVDKAGELLKAQGGVTTPPDRTLAIPERDGWRVVYLGTPAGGSTPPAPGRKGLSIVAETTFSPDSGQLGALKVLVPSKTAPASLQSYARSLDEGENAVLSGPDKDGPFLEAVVRESDGTFSVYVISQRREEGERSSAAGNRDSVLFGRDFLVRIGTTGKPLIASEKLHDGVAVLPLHPRAPGAPLLHEHDKGDLPAPTDVALVLRHPALAPLLVLTRRYIFRVDREGTVTWLGPNPNPKPAASPAPPAPAGSP